VTRVELICDKGSQAELRKVIGSNIARWLAETRLPLKYIATELGISVSICSQWKNGHRYPSPEHLTQLAALFKTTPACLLCPDFSNSTCSAKTRDES